MKVVIINHSDSLGGASIVSYRLLKALQAQGIDASMLVSHKAGNDPTVHVAASSWRIKSTFITEHARIFAANGFDRTDLFKASIATDGLPLSRHPLVKDADVVMLNWINQGMLSLKEIGRIAKTKRVIWTMHDMWNMTGVCHHAGTCNRYKDTEYCRKCPLFHHHAGNYDYSYTTSVRKAQLYNDCKIHFVAVSTWLERLARKSALLQNQAISVIPNAFPVDSFYIEPRNINLPFDLPTDKKIILMGAARLDDPIKGLGYAIEVLNNLKRNDAVAVFFGALRNPAALDSLHFPHIHLGIISDPAIIRELYARASVIISTSLYETLPGTLIEGQASCTIPISFDNGGQSDIIDNGVNGYLIPSYDTAKFTATLDLALNGGIDLAAMRQSVIDRYSAAAVAKQYLELAKSM